MIKVLESPSNSKLIEILEQATGHIYQMSSLFVPTHNALLLEVIENDVAICSKLHKKFNPALTLILVTLLNFKGDSDFNERVHTLTELHLSKNLSQLPSASVLTCEIHKSLHQRRHLVAKDSMLVKRDHDRGLTHPIPLS